MFTESMVSGLHASSFFLFLYSVMVFFIYQKDVKNLQKEKEELKNENKKLEYFVIEYLLLKMKNVESMQSSFVSMVCDYERGKELPNNFSYLICAYSECYEEMKKVIQEEIVRLTSYVTIDELQRKTFEDTEGIFLKQQKLNKLLNELKEMNKKRNGQPSESLKHFAETVSMIMEPAVRHRPSGGVVEM